MHIPYTAYLKPIILVCGKFRNISVALRALREKKYALFDTMSSNTVS
jgi:hypothetical protein